MKQSLEQFYFIDKVRLDSRLLVNSSQSNETFYIVKLKIFNTKFVFLFLISYKYFRSLSQQTHVTTWLFLITVVNITSNNPRSSSSCATGSPAIKVIQNIQNITVNNSFWEGIGDERSRVESCWCFDSCVKSVEFVMRISDKTR